MQYMLSRSCTAIYVCALLLSGSAVWNHFSLEHLCDHVTTDCQKLKDCTQVTGQHCPKTVQYLDERQRKKQRHFVIAKLSISCLADGVALRDY